MAKAKEFEEGQTIPCPNCDEDSMEWHKKEKVWRCRNANCGYELTEPRHPS